MQKLNYKRTILVGFAFFLISAFWQAYDATIPVILTNKFGMSQTWSGIIMALDNVLAVFMLPLFGALSDKCKTRFGKRTPFITIGTTLAAIALIAEESSPPESRVASGTSLTSWRLMASESRSRVFSIAPSRPPIGSKDSSSQ